MPAAPIPVALLGYGVAGAAFHAPLIAAEPRLRLTAIVTRDEQRRAAAAAAHPEAALLSSADEVWERAGELGLVVVATPNRTHVPLARGALAAGLPVVVDKPLAATADEARALAAEADAAGLLLAVFQNRRWDGDLLTARRLIEAGELGRVLRFESRFERWRPEIKEGWRERADAKEAGGVLYDLGSHLIDQALVLFGPVSDVYAERDARRPGAVVDDDAFVALRHVSGVRSHLWMSAVAAELGPRLRVLGERAAYVKHGLDVQEAALRDGGATDRAGWGEEPEARWGVVGAGEDWRTEPTERGAYPAFYAGVASALLDGAPSPVPLGEVVAALEVLDAARRSAAEGAVVRL
jgi:predicted dehydrogenase